MFALSLIRSLRGGYRGNIVPGPGLWGEVAGVRKTNKSELPLPVDVKTRSIYYSHKAKTFFGERSFFFGEHTSYPRHISCQRPWV